MRERWSAGALLAILVILVAGCAGHVSASGQTKARTSTTTTSPPLTKPGVTVDLDATPKGWVPIDFGDAQVSVPSSWAISLDTCQQERGTVYLGIQNNLRYGCPPVQSDDAVGLIPVPRPTPKIGTEHPTVVNGIDVFRLNGSRLETFWLVPSLGVELILRGTLSTRVLGTLTHSPRSLVLARGTHASVPSSWHRVTFGGVSIAVPGEWPEVQSSSWGSCISVNLSLFAPIRVVLNAGTTPSGIACPAFPAIGVTAGEPTDGLVIDPGPLGPLQAETDSGVCLQINGLTACPTSKDLYGVLVLAVHLSGASRPVAVEIGLGGNGVIVRTILYSIRSS